jgi:hypothetical protein
MPIFKIEEKELRIGNFVALSETDMLFKVESISSTGLDVSNDDEETWIEIESFEPVPLTEEWLLRFGFEKKRQSGRIYDYCYIKNGLYYAPMDFHRWVYKNKSLEDVEIKYLHQLQNLHFALTGKELIYNNK